MFPDKVRVTDVSLFLRCLWRWFSLLRIWYAWTTSLYRFICWACLFACAATSSDRCLFAPRYVSCPPVPSASAGNRLLSVYRGSASPANTLTLVTRTYFYFIKTPSEFRRKASDDIQVNGLCLVSNELTTARVTHGLGFAFIWKCISGVSPCH